MSAVLRLSLLAVAALLSAACDPPPQAVREGAPKVETPSVNAALPPAVDATVKTLVKLAEAGSYRDMAKLADQTPGFRSNNAGMNHKDYWYLKLRAGDWPMAHMQKVLEQDHALVETAEGQVYIWPALALVRLEQITPAKAREIDALLGQGQADAVRAGAPWPGYVLGISEDGTWLYFVSGAG
jgi:hypothetical protein